MNREIKFRGKRIDNGEWVYGCLTRYSEEISYITVDIVNDEVYKVDTKTVGQYTGLDDKNKVEIYGGDVIQYDDYKGTVKWEDMGFKIKNEFVDPESDRYQTHRHDKNYKLQRYFPEHTEVIGNIYSNPELIT